MQINIYLQAFDILSYFHGLLFNKMDNSKPEVNIIYDVLNAMVELKPTSVFIQSIYRQYCERGGLSKKQLEGLHSMAIKTNSIQQSKLATLEAIIKKRPTRDKSTIINLPAMQTKDEAAGKLMQDILAKYPQHKRVMFLKSKYNNNEMLTAAEIAELQKFGKLLLK